MFPGLAFHTASDKSLGDKPGNEASLQVSTSLSLPVKYCHNQGHITTANVITLQPVLPDSDVFVSRCVMIESNPDKVNRKIPRALEIDKARIQIGGF